jgi:hypothetical protein
MPHVKRLAGLAGISGADADVIVICIRATFKGRDRSDLTGALDTPRVVAAAPPGWVPFSEAAGGWSRGSFFSHQFRQLRNIRRNPPRLDAPEQISGRALSGTKERSEALPYRDQGPDPPTPACGGLWFTGPGGASPKPATWAARAVRCPENHAGCGQPLTTFRHLRCRRCLHDRGVGAAECGASAVGWPERFALR